MPDAAESVSGRRKLLLVGGDRTSRQALVQLLAGEGFTVDEVNSGAQALVRLQSIDYDAVMIDFYMPEMSGLELAAFIRDGYIGATRPPVLIALSSDLSVQDQEHAATVFDRVFLEPIEAQTLSAMLADNLAATNRSV